jgi:hypothetical protein
MSDQLLPLSKEAFLKVALPEEVVEVDGLGPVRIRSLSRAEFMDIRERDRNEWEVGLVAYGLAEPVLSEDEVRAWRTQQAAPKMFDDLAGEVLRVSGLRPTSVGDAKRTFPEKQ